MRARETVMLLVVLVLCAELVLHPRGRWWYLLPAALIGSTAVSIVGGAATGFPPGGPKPVPALELPGYNNSISGNMIADNDGSGIQIASEQGGLLERVRVVTGDSEAVMRTGRPKICSLKSYTESPLI